jgi:hypothetical protein
MRLVLREIFCVEKQQHVEKNKSWELGYDNKLETNLPPF